MFSTAFPTAIFSKWLGYFGFAGKAEQSLDVATIIDLGEADVPEIVRGKNNSLDAETDSVSLPLIAIIHKNENGRLYTRIRTAREEWGLNHGKYFFPHISCANRMKPGPVRVTKIVDKGSYGFFIGEMADDLRPEPATTSRLPVTSFVHQNDRGMFTILKADDDASANGAFQGKIFFPDKTCEKGICIGPVQITDVEDKGAYGFFRGKTIPYRLPNLSEFGRYVSKQPDYNTWLTANVYKISAPEIGTWLQVDRGCNYPLTYFAQVDDSDEVKPRLDIEEIVGHQAYQRSLRLDAVLSMEELLAV